jgi:hypothetical protein
MQEAAVKTTLDVLGAAPMPKRRYVHAVVKVTAGEPRVGMNLLSVDTGVCSRVASFTFSSLDLLEQGKLPLVLEPLESGHELQAGMHLIEAEES